MVTLIFLVVILLLIVLAWWRFHRTVLRKMYYDELELIYNKIELSIIKNNVPITRDLKEYLVRFKQYVVNPELTDIEVFLFLRSKLTKDDIQKSIELLNRVESYLPNEVISLSHEFTRAIIKAIKLSMWNWPFATFILKKAIRVVVKDLTHASIKRLKLAWNSYIKIPDQGLAVAESYQHYRQVAA